MSNDNALVMVSVERFMGARSEQSYVDEPLIVTVTKKSRAMGSIRTE